MTDTGGRATLRIVLTTVAVPLAVLALGIWELGRSGTDHWELEIQRGYLKQVVARMEAQIEAAPQQEMGVQFRRNGQLYGGRYAVQKAREALDDAGMAVAVSEWRQVLPPVTIACAGLTAALSVLALAGVALLARAGRASRDALVRGFSVLHRLLPPLLCLQVLLVATCSVTVVGFETLALLETGDFSSGSLKLLAVAALLIGASLWTAIKSVLQLRRTAALFTPDPLIVLGRPVSAEAAPGLWRLLDDLAARLGALRPDNVVVGLTGGFFVSSGPKLLQPGGVALEGRTLYLPLPFLPLLRPDELAAIIGHELAHFSGSDTEYSLRFLPIYAGVERSLDAVVAAGTTSAGSLSLLTRPALRLGLFTLERFHHTVRHWSRLREFEADAAGASVTTADAVTRALLRNAAAEARVDETLGAAFRAPGTAPADLVAATLAHATATGFDDPAARLEERQPHPTDTHPPTRQRLIALGRQPDAAALAEAVLPPEPDAAARLTELFADPEALCRAATADFLQLARDRARAEHQALQDAAAAVDDEEQALHEDKRGTAGALIGMGVVFALLGAALLAFGLNGLGPTERWSLGGVAVAAGVGVTGWALLQWRRRPAPFLLLRREELSLPGLDRAIAWAHVADLDLALERGRVSTRLLLRPEAPFPVRGPGGRRVKLDARQRIVTFKAGLPRGMKVDGYADLLARYRMADLARRELAAETAPLSGAMRTEAEPGPPTSPASSPPASLPLSTGGVRQSIWAALGVLMFASFFVAMMVYTAPPLLSDWRIHAAAQPAQAGRVVKGSCTTHLIFTICDLTLSNRTPTGTVLRSVNFAFTDVHFGGYGAEAMADPAHPELVTTDLALDTLWNRTLTFLFAAVLLGGLVVVPTVALVRKRGATPLG